MWKKCKNGWTSDEPHAEMHTGENHTVVWISPGGVSLHNGQSYAHSSDSFYGIICHTGYIFFFCVFAPSVGSMCIYSTLDFTYIIFDTEGTLKILFMWGMWFFSETDENLMNHMQKRILQRSTWLLKSVLKWFLPTVASHMLIQATVFMKSFTTQGTFLQRLLKSGVFAPSVGNMSMFNHLTLPKLFFDTGCTCKYFSCDKCEETNILKQMTTLWTTCKKVCWREAHSCSD